MSMYYVYLWENTHNGKGYVGKGKGRRADVHRTVAFSHPDRCPYFYKALRKYGIDSFYVEILADGLTEEDAHSVERKYIDRFDTFENGYNLTLGGEGCSGAVRSESTKEKIRLTKLGPRNPNFGKSPSPEAAAKRIAKITGSKRSAETKAKMAVWQIKTTSAEDTNIIILRSLGARRADVAEWFGLSEPTIKRRFRRLQHAC